MFNENFEVLDYIIVGLYLLLIIGAGLWFSRTKKGTSKTPDDYFLAGRSLPWWAIGASLIAANISAEQFIGMSGSGFRVGLAIASYEFMAALTLIIVAKYFLPVFHQKKISTIPGFVEKRFSTNLRTILAVFWIALYIFVNLTSVLFLGAKAIDTIAGLGDGALIIPVIILLAFVAAAYSIHGGLAAVAWTDVIQVVLLVIGGVLTTIFALDKILPDGGIIDGLKHVWQQAPRHFNMILPRENPEYINLPGIAVLIGGLWVANLYYWGFNQYIIQRAFAAKSLPEAQKGLVFAGFLKLVIPLIVVIPGIVAYVMYQENFEGAARAFEGVGGGDRAYPWLIGTLIPVGLKGLVVAALFAAIVSSLASMANSASTIFTKDIFKHHVNKNLSRKQEVTTGRVAALVALVIACLVAPAMKNFDQMFIYIQEYTGLVSPGILAIFLAGLFWKKATNRGAITGVLVSIPVAIALKFLPIEMPFMDQMMYTCLITLATIILVSLGDRKGGDDEKGIIFPDGLFKTSPSFNLAAYIICIILAVIYVTLW